MKEKAPFKYLAHLLFGGGLLGLLASFMLTIDTINKFKDPSYSPPCNINPIVSCGSVMNTEQASVLGFTNSLFGIAAFGALAAIGAALLAGAKLKGWLWTLMWLAAAQGVVFVHWLIYQSLYKIGSLCPYCMVVWVVTIPIFWYLTLYLFRGSGFAKGKIGRFVYSHHVDILVAWFLIIIALILNRFWFYWSTLI